MQYILGLGFLCLIVCVVCQMLFAILIPVLVAAGVIVGGWIVCWLCWLLFRWLWTFTPIYKKRESERKKLQEEMRRRELEDQEEMRRREMEEKKRRAADVAAREARFSDELAALCGNCEKTIVDTNVFMDAVEVKDATVTEVNSYWMSIRFFEVIRKRGIKIQILVSQLNELGNIGKEGDAKKKYRARGAIRIIEELQGCGSLTLLGDATTKKTYADSEIIKVVQKFVKEKQRLLVITNDRNLKIRINDIGAQCKSLLDLHESFRCDVERLGLVFSSGGQQSRFIARF